MGIQFSLLCGESDIIFDTIAHKSTMRQSHHDGLLAQQTDGDCLGFNHWFSTFYLILLLWILTHTQLTQTKLWFLWHFFRQIFSLQYQRVHPFLFICKWSVTFYGSLVEPRAMKSLLSHKRGNFVATEIHIKKKPSKPSQTTKKMGYKKCVWNVLTPVNTTGNK